MQDVFIEVPPNLYNPGWVQLRRYGHRLPLESPRKLSTTMDQIVLHVLYLRGRKLRAPVQQILIILDVLYLNTFSK